MKAINVLRVQSESSPPYWTDYSTAEIGNEVIEFPCSVEEVFDGNEDIPEIEEWLEQIDGEPVFSSGFWFVVKCSYRPGPSQVLYRLED